MAGGAPWETGLLRGRVKIKGIDISGSQKGSALVSAPCTCIQSADPLSGRIGVTVYDPFCCQRMHRVSGSTLRESSYDLEI